MDVYKFRIIARFGDRIASLFWLSRKGDDFYYGVSGTKSFRKKYTWHESGAQHVVDQVTGDRTILPQRTPPNLFNKLSIDRAIGFHSDTLDWRQSIPGLSSSIVGEVGLDPKACFVTINFGFMAFSHPETLTILSPELLRTPVEEIDNGVSLSVIGASPWPTVVIGIDNTTDLLSRTFTAEELKDKKLVASVLAESGLSGVYVGEEGIEDSDS